MKSPAPWFSQSTRSDRNSNPLAGPLYVGSMDASATKKIVGLTLTDIAAESLKGYVTDDLTCLRIGIQGGGCSGFRYQLALDHQQKSDLVFEDKGFKLLVAEEAIHLVDGSVVDFETGLQDSGFAVKNPNAVAACGCGSSFRVDDSPGC